MSTPVVRTQRLEDISKLLPGHLQWPPLLSSLLALSPVCWSGTHRLPCFLNLREDPGPERSLVCTLFYFWTPVTASKGLIRLWVIVPEKISIAKTQNGPVSRRAGGFWGRNPREELKIPHPQYKIDTSSPSTYARAPIRTHALTIHCSAKLNWGLESFGTCLRSPNW